MEANEVLKQTRFAKRQAKRVQEQDAVRLQRRRCCLAPYFQEWEKKQRRKVTVFLFKDEVNSIS